MRHLLILFFLISSSASAATLRGEAASELLGKSEILDSTIEMPDVKTGQLSEDNMLILEKRRVLSLVQYKNTLYMCDHIWENVHGGNGNAEPFWRQSFVVCSN